MRFSVLNYKMICIRKVLLEYRMGFFGGINKNNIDLISEGRMFLPRRGALETSFRLVTALIPTYTDICNSRYGYFIRMNSLTYWGFPVSATTFMQSLPYRINIVYRKLLGKLHAI